MKKINKIKTGFLLIVMLVAFGKVNAQDTTIVEAKSTDISNNLDLEAVATLFGVAKDLEDFEKRLNDPKTQISNLDLNENGEVDYLRVIEAANDSAHAITIQAVIGKDRFQDVATIDVVKDKAGETQVQVIGDVYMYGQNYIIEPIYVSRPIIYMWFWSPHYRYWYSPYYWGYYPPYFYYWYPYPTYIYTQRVYGHVNVFNTYHYGHRRRSTVCANLHKTVARNDYQKENPNRSFVERNEGLINKKELVQDRSIDPKVSTGKQVQDEWKPESDKPVQDNKVVVPNKKTPIPVTQPNSNPVKTPVERNPQEKPVQQPTKPVKQPNTPVTKPKQPVVKPKTVVRPVKQPTKTVPPPVKKSTPKKKGGTP